MMTMMMRIVAMQYSEDYWEEILVFFWIYYSLA